METDECFATPIILTTFITGYNCGNHTGFPLLATKVRVSLNTALRQTILLLSTSTILSPRITHNGCCHSCLTRTKWRKRTHSLPCFHRRIFCQELRMNCLGCIYGRKLNRGKARFPKIGVPLRHKRCVHPVFTNRPFLPFMSGMSGQQTTRHTFGAKFLNWIPLARLATIP